MTRFMHHPIAILEYLLCSFHHSTYSSYDETICTWDSRNFKSPLRSRKMGGGVWRIRQSPRDPTLLGLACMGNGFHIIREDPTNLGAEEPLTHLHYQAHESLAYGLDWKYDGEEGSDGTKAFLASCSFYDHLFSVWSIS